MHNLAIAPTWSVFCYRFTHSTVSLNTEMYHGLVGCIGFQRHFNSLGHIMAVGDAYVFPGFLTPVLTQLFFPKPQTSFLTCFCRGERRKYAGKKSRLNRGSNSQPPGHESDTLTTEPPRRGCIMGNVVLWHAAQ